MIKLMAKAGGTEWTINSDKTDTIWKKNTYHRNTTQSPIVQAPGATDSKLGGLAGEQMALHGEIDMLRNQIAQIRADLTNVSNEQKRIIILIKKLHHIQ